MRRALVLLLLVAACGGSSSGSSSGGKAAYLKQAEAICATANADTAAAKKNLPTDIAAVPAYVHKLVDVARKDVTDLSALTPPKGDAADISAKVLQPLKAQLADADAFAAKVDAAAAAKNNQKLTDLILHPPTQTKADVAWMKTYGFKACVTAADTGGTAK
jgi:cytochrome c556